MNIGAGTIKYFNEPYKAIVEIDDNIGIYYRSLIPKHIQTNKQKYSTHISFVRKEIPMNIEFWGKYDGDIIQFEYESMIYNDETYFWLNVFCDKLEEIRKELGLDCTSPITRSPDGRHKFHITIANMKENHVK